MRRVRIGRERQVEKVCVEYSTSVLKEKSRRRDKDGKHVHGISVCLKAVVSRGGSGVRHLPPWH